MNKVNEIAALLTRSPIRWRVLREHGVDIRAIASEAGAAGDYRLARLALRASEKGGR